jgi:hypothetical protein
VIARVSPASVQEDTRTPETTPAEAERRRGRIAWGARLARRHWALVALLVAGSALRVLTQLAYRPALLYIDSTKYLLHGMEEYDPVGYRALVRPVLWFGDLSALAAVQHVLGLAMAVVVYALLIRRGVPRWAATPASAPVLLDAYQLQIEQTIMPEVMFEALVVAGLAVLLWTRRLSSTLVIVAGCVLGASAIVRQVGELLAVPGLVFVVLATRGRLRRVGHAALFGAFFALPIVAYMTYSATVLDNGFRLSSMNDSMLYGRAAVSADCPALDIPAGERPLCPSPETASGLGVDGLVNSPASPVHTYVPPPGTNRSEAIEDFSHSVLAQQPLRVAGSITTDFLKLFAPTRNDDRGDPPISRWQFQTTYPTYPPRITPQTSERIFQGTGGGGAPTVVRSLAAPLRAYQLHGGHAPGPFLLVTLLAGLGGVLSYRRGRNGPAALACLLVTGAGLAAVLGADLYEFSWRYQLPALVTLPAAGALGVAAIRARVRTAPASRPPGHRRRWTRLR